MADTTPQTPPEGTQPVAPTEDNKGKEGEGTTPVAPVEPKPEVTPPAPVPPPAPPAKEEPDYRTKFGESTRRNQIVESQFNELRKVLGDITKTEVPTDDEMKAQVPDWEYLTDREKNNERKLIVLERRSNKILHTMDTIASETENASKLDKFIATVPELKGKEEEFYNFASNPKNKGASMETLLSAFLFDLSKLNPPAPVVTPPEEIPPSFERGSSSGNMPPEQTGKKEYSDEELKALRTQNPQKYHELIRKGLI